MVGRYKPNSQKYNYLHQLTLEQLLELLVIAPIPASTQDDEVYNYALEEVILEKEHECSTGFLPDVDQQWSEFREFYRVDDDSALSGMISTDTFKMPARIHRIWKTALVAVATVVFMLGGMVVTQAAGFDVFGTMTRWTANTFSLGIVRSEGAIYFPADVDENISSDIFSGKFGHASLQEVLDANSITEVAAPAWMPDGYVLTLVEEDPEWLLIYAEYANGTDVFQISIASYFDTPNTQVEKTDLPPETFQTAGITFYLIENTSNYTIAWCTDQYECYICGALDQKENLKKIVYSMYE